VAIGPTSGKVTVAPSAPGLFAIPGTGVAAATALRVSASGRQQPLAVFDCSAGTCVAAPLPLDSDSTVYVTLYGTGTRGGVSPATCTVGGERAQVLYAGSQTQYPGLDQVNIALPAAVRGRGQVDVVVTAGGVASNPVRIHAGSI
jgi:uncharacterized protein (TIGR03437 family)